MRGERWNAAAAMLLAASWGMTKQAEAFNNATGRWDTLGCTNATSGHCGGFNMAELAKVRRVVANQIPDAPHETLLTVDATTGQNGLRQARLFSEAVGVDGLVLTKLDGTAKGGIALAIASELAIPVKLIGVGEQLEDLRPFEPLEYARALVS